VHSKTFVITHENHTLGNSLRYMVMRDPQVDLCGYTVPHPMEQKMNVRVQTNGSKSAEQALSDGAQNLSRLCTDLTNSFDLAIAASTK